MMHNTYKREIIALIKEMEGAIGKETLPGLFDNSDNASGDRRVGCNQFREIAANCRAAECYEEILLLIQYTRSKSKGNQSWKTICNHSGKTFGEIVEEYMCKVKSLCGEDAQWDELREPVQLFFGYLYWQSRIWADQYGKNSQITNGGKKNAVH